MATSRCSGKKWQNPGLWPLVSRNLLLPVGPYVATSMVQCV